MIDTKMKNNSHLLLVDLASGIISGALASLNVDDDVPKVLDDAVENQFFDEYLKGLSALPDDAELETIDVSKALENWMAKKYNNTTISKG